jgi:hypothetical protein
VVVVVLDVRPGGDGREPDDPAAQLQNQFGRVGVEATHRVVHRDATEHVDRTVGQHGRPQGQDLGLHAEVV